VSVQTSFDPKIVSSNDRGFWIACQQALEFLKEQPPGTKVSYEHAGTYSMGLRLTVEKTE
jgi:hypothetical protein